jgi:hypothetical protein
MMKYYMQMIFLSLLILLQYRIYAQSTFNCGDVSFNEDVVNEQNVWAEANIAMPQIAGYAYHKKNWEGRIERRLNNLYIKENV